MKASLVTLVIVTGMGSPAVVGREPSKFEITTKRSDDTVEFRVAKDGAVFSVKSPFGIGQAVVKRTSEEWPGTVVLRLHLKGLEGFKASNGKDTLCAAMSSQDGTARLWLDGKEDEPIDAKSPNWMVIRIIGNDGKPAKAIPLKDGYFEMVLPKALFDGNPKAISLNWIDFYRN